MAALLGGADRRLLIELSAKAAIHGGDFDSMLRLIPMDDALCASRIWPQFAGEFKTLRWRYDADERRKLLSRQPSAQQVPDSDAA
jgi:hypothetical protein